MKYHVTIEVEVELPDNYLYALLESSRNHYDFKCRSLSEQGGFLYGWKNSRDWDQEDKIVVMDSRKTNLLAKVAEGIPKELGTEVSLFLRELFFEIQAKTESANAYLNI